MSAKNSSHRSGASRKSIDLGLFASFETLENRQLRSAVPNFSGSYTAVVNGSAIECDLSKAGSRYRGIATENGQTLSITAKIKHGKLSGSLTNAAGEKHTFAAALHGNSLHCIVDGNSSVMNKTVNLSGGAFTVAAPSNWSMQDGQGGLIVTSPDKTLRASNSTALVNQTLTPHDLVLAAQSQGSTILSEQLLANQTVNGVNYQEESVVLAFNDQSGTTFGTGLILDTASANGQTEITIRSLTAPAANFSSDASVLTKVLKSVKQTGQNKSTKQTRYYDDMGNWISDYSSYDFGGFYDPGVEGGWSSSGGYSYDSVAWPTYDNGEPYGSASYFTSVDSYAGFDSYSGFDSYGGYDSSGSFDTGDITSIL